MDDKILIYPDFKLYINYSKKGKCWRVKSPVYSFTEKSESLSEALMKTVKVLEELNKKKGSIEIKDNIQNIIKSNLFIEFSGEFYLCIYHDFNDKYNVVYFSQSFELMKQEIDNSEVDLLLKAIEKLKIQPFYNSGFDGEMNYLKIGAGLNSTTFQWWSETYDNWEGLKEVISIMNRIKP